MDSSQNDKSLATVKTVLSAIGSISATVMLLRSLSHEFFPQEFRDYILFGVRNLFSRFSNQFTVVIDEFDGITSNQIYESAVVYLSDKVSPKTRRLKISKPEKEKHYTITMERGEEVIDVYKGCKVKWVWISKNTKNKNLYNSMNTQTHIRPETRSFELTFHKRDRDLVVNSYLPYIVNEAEKKKQEKRTLKIFTMDYQKMQHLMGDSDLWIPVPLDHPATFDTLAMESDQKDMIMSDLDRFVKRKEYYRKVGKAWKRGYLLYGPPGTGKSSLIAAIANYLNFDVYDLELTQLTQNSDLRKLLLMTANKSILVVEDIDCTIDFQENLGSRASTRGFFGMVDPQQDRNKVTLSGLLNFVDGLWSSCGDERIIIFTTNHIEKLDPALLRPGRMDVHINMSYCSSCGFKLLASNYLGIVDHRLFEEVENLIVDAKVTPAEVAEMLLKNDDPDASLQGLIQFMHDKIEENAVSEES